MRFVKKTRISEKNKEKIRKKQKIPLNIKKKTLLQSNNKLANIKTS